MSPGARCFRRDVARQVKERRRERGREGNGIESEQRKQELRIEAGMSKTEMKERTMAGRDEGGQEGGRDRTKGKRGLAVPRQILLVVHVAPRIITTRACVPEPALTGERKKNHWRKMGKGRKIT